MRHCERLRGGTALAFARRSYMTPRGSLRENVHELRNAVTGVVSWAKMLATGRCGELTGPQALAVARMVDGATRALETVCKLEALGESAQEESAPPAAVDPVPAERAVAVAASTELPEPTIGARSDAVWQRDPKTGCWRPCLAVSGRRARTPIPGSRIDGLYLVLEVLGQGGMGVVLRARDERLLRDVAVKLIHPAYMSTPGAREQFLREAQSMAKIRHPNVVEVHSYGQHGDVPYLVMEYVRGVDLESYRAVRRPGTLAVDEALGILDQLCSGVSAIHDARAVHRDLKHSNVLIGPAFRVAVTDLGLTHGMDEGRGGACIAGTPGFMAPEVLLNRNVPAELAPRADVYSLGVMAFELLTGESLFDEPELPELIERHCYAKAPRPSDVCPDLPPAFDDVITNALAKDPIERTPSSLEFRRQLLQARSTVRESYPSTRVLIVDDDPAWRGYLTQQVHESLPGAHITSASDGQDALSCVASDVPSIAIIDLKMPRLNGFELIAALRGQSDTRATQVVVVTAHGGGRDWELLRGLGVTGFFVKPLEPSALAAVLRRAAASHVTPRGLLNRSTHFRGA